MRSWRGRYDSWASRSRGDGKGIGGFDRSGVKDHRLIHLGFKPQAHRANPLKRVERLECSPQLFFSPFQRTLAVSLGFKPQVVLGRSRSNLIEA
jgi:hypothetical protein